MKLDVLIPSRGRAQSLQAVIVGMDALTSGEHDVRYVVLCDSDDPVTAAVVSGIDGIKIDVAMGPRRLINAWENEIIAASDADAFMPWADDLFCLAPAWDEIVRRVLEKVPAFSWQEIQDQKNHTAIVAEAKWVKAAGKFFPEHFPFWFADTWLKEVFGFVYGMNMPIIEALQFSHKRTPTLNMRDLDFWFRVFAQTRGERIAEAERIVSAYGLQWKEPSALLALFERGDAMQLERVPQYERAFGADQGEPSATYMIAKAKAERLLSVEAAFEAAA